MTIAAWVEKAALKYPEKTAVQFEGAKISYGDFDQEIKNTAAMLFHALDIRRGDRVAYLGQNHPRMLYVFFACLRIGAIFLPLNWRLTAAEHHHMLTESGAAALFVDGPYEEQCQPLKAALKDVKFVHMSANDKPGWYSMPKRLRETKTLSAGLTDDPSDPALLIFTSGTTGHPKGAVLTKSALETNAKNSVNMHDMTFDDIILTILPLFHVGGLNIQTTAAFYVGATVVLHRTFEAERAIAALKDDHPSLTIILPAHMPLLASHGAWPALDLSSLRAVTTGSCVVPDHMTSFWHDRNIPLLQVYGASETCPIAIHQTAKDAFETAGSIGFPAKYCAVRIVDENDEDCAVDQAGEILIKGDNVMISYWQDAPETKKSLKEGWFYTGDMGYQDAKGGYHFVDRKKDMIISGGENIYPAELEVVLGGHPDILEAAVVGRPDDRWGEAVVAFIVLKAGTTVSREDVLNWLGGRLGRYKHPRDIHFIAELPRNEMRKILKDTLRAMT